MAGNEHIVADRARRAVVAFFADRGATSPGMALPYRPSRTAMTTAVERMVRARALVETAPQTYWLDGARLDRVAPPGRRRRVRLGLALASGVAGVAWLAIKARARDDDPA